MNYYKRLDSTVAVHSPCKRKVVSSILTQGSEKIYFNVLCNIETKCWEWKKGKDESGYGFITVKGKNKRAHRFSYEIFVSKIKDKMQINHICNNRRCVNPNHLEQVTHIENGSREKANHYNSRKKFCKRGHEYNEENTKSIMRPYGHNGWGMRECRLCRKITSKRYRMGLSPKRVTLEQRFMQKVFISTNGCWEWTASKQLGYGKFKYNNEMRLAHRVSYKIFKGEFDEELVVDHMCYNRGCVNPEHLQLLTLKENSQKGGKKVDKLGNSIVESVKQIGEKNEFR